MTALAIETVLVQLAHAGLRLVLANKTNGLKRWTVVRTVERAAADNANPAVARVAPSCEIEAVADTAEASQFDDVRIF